MKIFFFSIITLTSIVAPAQLKLKPGMKILSHISSQVENDMGSGMTMNTNAETDIQMVINEERKNVYEFSTKVLNLNMQLNMMGQETVYDSKNEKDKETEAGKMFSPLMEKEYKYMVNKADGKVFPIIEKDSANKSISTLPNSEEINGSDKVMEAFLVITNDRKKAGTWTITDSTEGAITRTTYTIKSISGEEAFVTYEVTSLNNSTKDQMGMSITMKMRSTGKGEIICDTKTMLVKKNSVVIDTSGTMEVAGQNSELTGKSTTVTTFVVQ